MISDGSSSTSTSQYYYHQHSTNRVTVADGSTTVRHYNSTTCTVLVQKYRCTGISRHSVFIFIQVIQHLSRSTRFTTSTSTGPALPVIVVATLVVPVPGTTGTRVVLSVQNDQEAGASAPVRTTSTSITGTITGLVLVPVPVLVPSSVPLYGQVGRVRRLL
jgi:hypothetical protein